MVKNFFWMDLFGLDNVDFVRSTSQNSTINVPIRYSQGFAFKHIMEKEDSIVYRLPLCGVKREDISVSITKEYGRQNLALKFKASVDVMPLIPVTDKNYFKRIDDNTYEVTSLFALSSDPYETYNKINLSLENGILTITVYKEKSTQNIQVTWE